MMQHFFHNSYNNEWDTLKISKNRKRKRELYYSTIADIHTQPVQYTIYMQFYKMFCITNIISIHYIHMRPYLIVTVSVGNNSKIHSPMCVFLEQKNKIKGNLTVKCNYSNSKLDQNTKITTATTTTKRENEKRIGKKGALNILYCVYENMCTRIYSIYI